jgi:hypothetical protein
MTYYLLLDNNNIIVDCVTKPQKGYVKWQGVLSESVHAGWHRLINNQIVKDEVLFTELIKQEEVI